MMIVGLVKGWEPFFEEHSVMIGEILDVVHSRREEMEALPNPQNVFRMFRLLPLERVRVIMMGQDPYPSVCPITSIPYASGIAFYPLEGTKKVPRTLMEMELELRRNLSLPLSRKGCPPRGVCLNRELIRKWIHQGIFMTNVGLTVGTRCEEYLVDHKVLWERFSRAFVRHVSQRGRNVVFCFLGTDAWRMSEEVRKISSSFVKVYHPVSRDRDKSLAGSEAYSKINDELMKLGEQPIRWTL